MPAQTILFLGSTGGCTNSCLTHALRSGHECIALVRTPNKLAEMLTTQQGLDLSRNPSNLTIVPGDATSVSDLKTALLSHSDKYSLPDTIVSGLGSSANIAFEFCNPLELVKPTDPTLTQRAARELVTALREIYAERQELNATAMKKPRLVFVSTTGVTRGPEDVPASMRFLYHRALAQPHADKREMENVFRADAEQADEKARVFYSVSAVRPTLLTGTGSTSEGIGWQKIRAGTEDKPELGYKISRADVGEWMYVNLVREGSERARWEGNMVSLSA